MQAPTFPRLQRPPERESAAIVRGRPRAYILAMSGVVATKAHLPAGGGAYALPMLTVGVFLTDQPAHRLSLGADRRRAVPLTRLQGWILPAGAEGMCEFDAPLEVATVALPSRLLRDTGLAPTPEAAAPVVGALDPLLAQLVVQADRFADGGQLYRQTMEQALAAQVSQLLAPAAPEVAGIDDARVRRAIAFIQDQLNEDVSLEAMAGVAAMSPAQFTRAFRRATGASPLQYVIAERLEAAKRLLQTTQLSVAEIAFRVGYADVSRFGQHFKRRFGATPGAARAG